MQLVEGNARTADARHRRVALLALTVLHDVPCLAFVSYLEKVSRIGHALQTQHLNGRGWRRIFYDASAVVKHGAHFAEYRAADEEVSGVQRAILNENRSHGTAPLVHARFQHGTSGRRVRIGFELPQIGDQQDGFE